MCIKILNKLIEYFDSIWYSSLQAKLAVCSFIVGAAIVLICLFAILPIGEIATSALQAAGMFLVLAGGFAGVKVAFDLQSQKFSNQIENLMNKVNDKEEKETKYNRRRYDTNNNNDCND